MTDFGPKAEVRVACPACGREVYVNSDGTLRHHSPEGSKGRCEGSRRSAATGMVRVLKLKDGVVIKVHHLAGLLSDEEFCDELVLVAAEWDELVRVAAIDERSRFRRLVARWRSFASPASPSDTPARAYHVCASELERALEGRENLTERTNPDD